MSSLSLDGRPQPPGRPKPPQFNPAEHYGEVGGIEGVMYVQGKHFFNAAKQFVREAPENMQLKPLTPEQEQDRQRRLRENKRFFGSAKTERNAGGTLPQAVISAERENAQARAAEVRAE